MGITPCLNFQYQAFIYLVIPPFQFVATLLIVSSLLRTSTFVFRFLEHPTGIFCGICTGKGLEFRNLLRTTSAIYRYAPAYSP
nr:hypothetical protein Q903MT_gene2144 [Picea sitchensis]